MTNAMDITNLSDAALDVVLSVRSGEDFVDCSHLTTAERFQVIEALSCEKNARTVAWIAGFSGNATAKKVRYVDHEGMILARQDDHFDGE